jgi:hypothetical protein
MLFPLLPQSAGVMEWWSIANQKCSINRLEFQAVVANALQKSIVPCVQLQWSKLSLGII